MDNYKVNLDRQSLLNTFIKAVHKYYPIGFEFSNEQFDGYTELNNLVNTKVNQVINNCLPENLTGFVDALAYEFENYSIRNDLYKQFPNYSFSIILDQNDSENKNVTLFLTLKVSLLCPYYTIFFEEITSHRNILSGSGSPINSTIIFLESQSIERFKNFPQLVEKTVIEYFEGYSYANHYILFTVPIKQGVPHLNQNATRGNNYLYDFLFDSQFYINLQVAK